MASSHEELSGSPRIVSLTDKYIPEVDIIKTLSDTIFGSILLGKFIYSGEFEVRYTYIKRLSKENSFEQRDLWSLVASSKKHPEKGFIPKMLAYSTFSAPLRGYLDSRDDQESLRQDLLDGDDFVSNIGLNKIRELYFEPFPENLKLVLHKKAKDKLLLPEKDLTVLVVSILKTLQIMKESSTHHGNVSLESIVPWGHAFSLYHPSMIPAEVNIYSRLHALAKHYGAPEVVDLVLECNSREEFEQVRDEVDWQKADVFSLALVVLELGTLVEEDDWYNEDMLLKKDILELKMNMMRENYSIKLTRILEAMLSPHQVRPDAEGLLKLAITHSTDLTYYQRLLDRDNSKEEDSKEKNRNSENSQSVSDAEVPRDFHSNQEVDSKGSSPEENVSDIDSNQLHKLAAADSNSKSKKATSPTSQPAEPQSLLSQHLQPLPQSPSTFPQNPARIQANISPAPVNDPVKQFAYSSFMYPLQVNQPSTSRFDLKNASSAVVLPPMLSTAVTDARGIGFSPSLAGTNAASGTVQRIERRYETSASPSKVQEGQTDASGMIFKPDLKYDPRFARPTGKTTVREDRSKSPKTVSITKYIIRNGEKIIISEEKFSGVDDGVRGYIDKREHYTPEPQKITQEYHSLNSQHLDQTPKNLSSFEPFQKQRSDMNYPPSSVKRSLEPVFGTDSIYRSQVSTSKLHSLAALQQKSPITPADMTKMAAEIKDKLDELIHKEQVREERESKLRTQEKESKSKKGEKSVGMNRDYRESNSRSQINGSSRTVTGSQIDLSNVQCCRDCKFLKQDKKGHLYKCLNHPNSPTYVELPGKHSIKKSRKSKTPQKKKVSVERKLFQAMQETDPASIRRSQKTGSQLSNTKSKSSKKLVALPQDQKTIASEIQSLRTRGNEKAIEQELINLSKVKKIKASLAESKQRRLKRTAERSPAHQIREEFDNRSRSKSKNKSQKKIAGNKKNGGTDSWLERMKMNDKEYAR